VARAVAHHPPKRGPRGKGGYVVADDDAEMVTVAVLLLPIVPTAQVTPPRPLPAAQEYWMVPPKLFTNVKLSVEVPVPPGAIVTELGAALSEKSPGTVLKLETDDHGPFCPPPEGGSACTSQ
jgi:hypothetical protein